MLTRGWSFTRDSNYRVLLKKILVFWIDRRMWEMAAYLRWSHIEVQLSALVWACLGVYITSGAPNENIVQNHLNIA